MRYWRRHSIDVLNDGLRKLSRDRAGVEADHGILIDLASRDHRLAGWYRLKYLFLEHEPQRIGVEAFDKKGRQIAAWTAALPGERFTGYVHIPADAASLQMAFEFLPGAVGRITATLRPVSLLEYVWRSLKAGFLRRPREFLTAFGRPNETTFLLFDFPRPAIRGNDYLQWIERREEEAVSEHFRTFPAIAAGSAQISLLLCGRGADASLLRRTIKSVRNQTSPEWRLVVVVATALNPLAKRSLARVTRQDSRIRVELSGRGVGPSAALNFALSQMSSRYVLRIDENGTLAECAVEACLRQLAAQPACKILYSDDDSIDGKGIRFRPYFKPRAFSPELFHSYNYLDRLVVYHTDTLRSAGGWHSEFDGAEDYDLNLRITEILPPTAISHVPLVLYHRQRSAADLAADAVEAGRRALKAHFARCSVPASVEIVPPNMYRVRYRLAEPRPFVSIIIPFRDRAELLRRCLASIFDKTGYDNFEVLLVNNNSNDPETLACLESYRSNDRVRILDDPRPFNYSALNNLAVREARGDFLCFFNNDLEVINADWLEDMLGYASQPGVACVGAKLYYADGFIQHAGLLLGLPSAAEHAFRRAAPDDPGYFGRLAVASNYSAVTGACLVVRREIFRQAGGFDETLPVAFNDVDLCLKLRKLGYRNVFTPFARLYHFEASTRGSDDLPENLPRFRKEIALMRDRYGDDLLDDSCYSPHLTHTKTDFSICLD